MHQAMQLQPGPEPAGPLPDPTRPLAHPALPTVPALFAAQARRTPAALALADASARLSYAELDAASARLARRLLELGLGRGQPVALFSHRSHAHVLGLLGILRAGAAFVVLDPSYPAERLARLAGAARPAALVAAEAAGPVPPALRQALRPSARGELTLPARPRPEASPAGELTGLATDQDPAYVAFTSGTTGEPKGVVGTHGPVSHFLRWHAATFGLGEEDRFALLSGLGHDPMVRDAFTPLTCGAALYVPEPAELAEPERLRAFLNRHRVTVLHLTPSLGRVLTHGARPGELPHLRHAFFGGEPLPRAAAERFRAAAPGAELVGFYGATETPQAMGYHRVRGPGEGAAPLGRGIEGVQLLVLPLQPEPGRPRLCGVGELGEVYVRTPWLARGYLGDAALTAARFLTNPFTGQPGDRLYRTGDLGRYLPDGEVAGAGRADAQVKIRGFRVEPGEVEAALAAHPAVRACCVVARPGAAGEAQLWAYAEGPALPEPAELRRFLRQRLPEHLVPREVVALARLPLTPAGKVDRAALPAPTRAGPAPAPADPVVAALCRLFAGALHLPQLGPEADFFEQGGDSLAGLDLLAAVERELGRRLPVRALLGAPTPARLASLVRGEAAAPTGVLVELQPGQAGRAPVYWLPGGGGLSTLAFRAVSARLGPEQPVYGLEAELDPARAPTTLPGLAASYVQAIRARQPRGPYHLLGFSLGAYTAYEMAVQLRRQGQAVGLLALFDTGPGDPLSAPWRGLLLAERGWHLLGQLRRAPAAQARARLARIADGLRAPPPPPRPAPQSDLERILERNRQAAFAYRDGPKPTYDGRVAVFLARESSLDGTPDRLDPRLLWRRHAQGVDAYRVPGNHLSMLESPHVDALAQQLRLALERASSSS